MGYVRSVRYLKFRKHHSYYVSHFFRNRLFRPGNNIRKTRRRAVLKNGECNVVQVKLAQKRIRFLQDIFTTLVDSQWRWCLASK